MIDLFEKVAFVGACYVGKVKRTGKHTGQWSAAEGIGRLFNADIWQGQSHDDISIEQLRMYDAVIVNFNSCHLEIPTKLKQGSPTPFIIGLAEGDAQDIEVCYDKIHKRLLRKAIYNCDVFGSLQKTAIPFFQSIGNNPNVIWMPAPCEEESFYLGKGNSKEDRIPDEVIAYVECGRSYDYTLAVLSNMYFQCKLFTIGQYDELEDTKYVIRGGFESSVGYSDFCAMLRHYKAGIRMDCRYVDGRFVKTLAGMRCASIGTNRVESQRVLFPDLSFDPIQEVGTAKEALDAVMTDETFRKLVVDKAYDRLIRIYSPERVAHVIRDQLCKFV